MLAMATAALLALVASVLLARRVASLRAELDHLAGVVQDLSARLASTEQDAAGALARTEAAEAVLVGKGLADEEDLEAARRRVDDGSGPDARREGELH